MKLVIEVPVTQMVTRLLREMIVTVNICDKDDKL